MRIFVSAAVAMLAVSLDVTGPPLTRGAPVISVAAESGPSQPLPIASSLALSPSGAPCARTRMWLAEADSRGEQPMRMFNRRFLRVASALGAACLALSVSIPLSIASAAPLTVAPGGPGALSHFDLARKDCLGTAADTASKVWYTVAGGVLSDVYYPTIDNTNVETLQYIVTDGSTFTDLQSRDMTYGVRAVDPGGMECQVTATAKSGAYRIVTDYFTDPGRNTLLMQVRVHNLTHSDLQVYVRFDASVNGNGGGGAGNGGADSATVDSSTGHAVLVSYDTKTTTNAVNRDYAQPVFAALDGPFNQATSGFAATASDGLSELDPSHNLTQLYSDALNGNAVQTGHILLHGRGDANLTLALGVGTDQASAVASAEGSLQSDLGSLRDAYRNSWSTYDAGLIPPPQQLPGVSSAGVRQLTAEYYL